MLNGGQCGKNIAAFRQLFGMTVVDTLGTANAQILINRDISVFIAVQCIKQALSSAGCI